jgi:mono/diheme cytochrome c family protein
MIGAGRGGNTPFSFLGLLAALLVATSALAQGDAKRGEYVSKAAGCLGCHTQEDPKAQPYAGGRELKTPFGTFFGPNITPHPQAGIGRWSEQDFARAMRRGERPDGAHYYPAFPYPSFTGITDQDLRDLWAYLRSLPQSDRANRPHELRFPYNWRWLVWFWKLLFFSPGQSPAPNPTPSATASPAVNRGAYLVNVLGHCGECHTPRNFLGGPKKGRHLAGAKVGEATATNLTPTGLKKSSDDYLREVLQTAMTPDGDVISESMAEVVRNTTGQLARPDLDALIAYLRSLPPLPNPPK